MPLFEFEFPFVVVIGLMIIASSFYKRQFWLYDSSPAIVYHGQLGVYGAVVGWTCFVCVGCSHYIFRAVK